MAHFEKAITDEMTKISADQDFTESRITCF